MVGGALIFPPGSSFGGEVPLVAWFPNGSRQRVFSTLYKVESCTIRFPNGSRRRQRNQAFPPDSATGACSRISFSRSHPRSYACRTAARAAR